VQKPHLKLVKPGPDLGARSQRATTAEQRLRFGAPLTGIAVAVLFYFAGPWISSLLSPAPSHPEWLYSVFGFGIGTAIGITIFGYLRGAP
jgi:hypothetical protein